MDWIKRNLTAPDVDTVGGHLLTARDELQCLICSFGLIKPAGTSLLQQRFGLPRYVSILSVYMDQDVYSTKYDVLQKLKKKLRRNRFETFIRFHCTNTYDRRPTAWIEVLNHRSAFPRLCLKVEFLKQGAAGFETAAAERIRQIIRTPNISMSWREWFDVVWLLQSFKTMPGTHPDQALLEGARLSCWTKNISSKLGKININKFRHMAWTFAPARAGWVVDLMKTESIVELLSYVASGPDAKDQY